MTTFRSAVLAQLRRQLIGPLPGAPAGSRYLRGVSIVPAEDVPAEGLPVESVPAEELDTVVFAIDLVIYGVPVRERFPVAGWTSLAVGSPSALGRALSAEVRLRLGEGLAPAQAGPGSPG